MFESEEAAKSRLQFISQLAGGAAGMSLLAACGGATPSSSGSLVPGSPMLAAGARAKNALGLADTPELQALLTKTGHYAVQHGSVAVIRHDMKRNAKLVAKINKQLALARTRMQAKSRLHSDEFLGDDGDGGDYDDVPEYTFVSNVSTTYLDDNYDNGDFGQYAGQLDPWNGWPDSWGPIFTLPAWLQNCGNETKVDVQDALLAVAEQIIAHSGEYGEKLVAVADMYTGDRIANLAFLLKLLGYGTASEILGWWDIAHITGSMIGQYIQCAKRYGWN